VSKKKKKTNRVGKIVRYLPTLFFVLAGPVLGATGMGEICKTSGAFISACDIPGRCRRLLPCLPVLPPDIDVQVSPCRGAGVVSSGRIINSPTSPAGLTWIAVSSVVTSYVIAQHAFNCFHCSSPFLCQLKCDY